MEHSTVFVDRLISALGLKSVTVQPRTAETARSDQDTLGDTGIRGRAVFSTKNRHLMQRALQMNPSPETVSDLGSQLERVCVESPCTEADAMLAAVRDASAETPGRRLEELAARG